MNDTTADEPRCSGRTLTGAAGALLLVRLATTTAHLATRLGGGSALAGRGELTDNHLVNQGDVGLHVEDVVRKVNRAGFLAGGAENVNGRHKSDSLGSSAHQDDAAAGPGYSALDQQQTLVGIHRVDREVLGGLANPTHATGHLHALEHATRGGACADGTRFAVVLVRTVRGADSVEAMALHDACESFALGGGDDVDVLSRLESRDRELLAQVVGRGLGGTYLHQVAARGDACLLEVARHGLVHLARVDRTKGDLNRVVTVCVGAADVRNHARTGLDHRDGNKAVLGIPDLGHSEFLAEHALDRALNSVSPVSYTHLRAHETVLDLVCRLLLEKKKQISITPENWSISKIKTKRENNTNETQ